MSTPAVPTASTPIAPTTKVESTQEAPHGQSVSQIGHGGAGPEEAMLHTGAFNTIDMYMRMQFLALASFRWDVNQAPGTLLWSAPITPKSSHQFIRHLQQMYNTWVGGFDYNVKVCGTGFHAGALAIVRLPPNIEPNTITSPADFTAFEYLIIDPKTLEVVTEHIIDQRRWMYHYNSDTGVDSIGGYIAVYVLVQLNTSSTGSPGIAVQVLTRPSQSFNFFQIKPLPGKGPEPEPEEPRAVALSLNVTDSNKQTTATIRAPVTKFIVAPNNMTNPRASRAGCFNFDGETIGPIEYAQFPIEPMTYNKYTLVSGKPKDVKFSAYSSLPPGDARGKLYLQYGTSESDAANILTITKVSETGQLQFSGSSSSIASGNYGFAVISQYQEKDLKAPLKPADESFFLFDNSDPAFPTDRRVSYQPANLANLLKSKEFSAVMNKQEAMIIDMYDADLDTPIRRLKLYHSGHITTKPSTDEITLEATKYYFRFVQISRAGEPIPAPPKNYTFNEKLSLWSTSPNQ